MLPPDSGKNLIRFDPRNTQSVTGIGFIVAKSIASLF